MKKIQYACPCSHEGERSILYNLKRVLQEIVEWLHCHSKEEASDIMMNMSCLLHAVVPAWVWLLPGAARSQEKGLRRYAQHGCCRSARNISPVCRTRWGKDEI